MRLATIMVIWLDSGVGDLIVIEKRELCTKKT